MPHYAVRKIRSSMVRLRRRLLIGLVLGLVLVAAIALITHAGRSGPRGLREPLWRDEEIVFTRMAAGGENNLHVVSPDGSHRRLLLPNASSAAISLDGRRLAFVRDGEIWTAARDGSRPKQVTRRPLDWADAGDPAWSPDGRTLYFSRSRKPDEGWSPDVFVVGVDGTRLRRLTNGGCEFAPAPSPDGSTVAYTSILSMRDLDCVEGANGSIEAISTVGRTKALPFRFPDSWTYEPAWAPDGRRLAYSVVDADSPDGPLTSIYVSAADGSRPRRMPTPKHASVASPAWSSHGTELALAVHGDIWVVAPDGSGLQQVTRGSSDDREPSWLPPPG